jgi:hypothetical protein
LFICAGAEFLLLVLAHRVISLLRGNLVALGTRHKSEPGDEHAPSPAARRANQFDCLLSSRTTRARDAQIRLRQKSKFACAFKLIWVVQSAREKYFALHSLHSLASLSHPASGKRGVRAIVTTREAGMRWTLSRQALLRETTGEMADGEVVWSWRPKAGVKVAGLDKVRRPTVTTKSGHRGEHEGHR